jgi:hypothetical protein
MKAGMTLLLGALAVCGCASAPPVRVVPAAPDGCTFLGEIHGYLQCGQGEPGDDIVKALKQVVRGRGGNTLQCCEQGTEAVVMAAYDRAGKIACTDFFEQTGRAYACPVPPPAR